MTTANKPKGAMPRWLAVILIILVIAGGGYVANHLIRSARGPSVGMVLVEDPQQAMRDGPIKRNDGGVSGHRNGVHFSCNPRDGSYLVSMYYDSTLRRQWAKGDEDLHRLAYRIMGNTRLAQHVELTPEQTKALNALPSLYAPRPTDEERKTIADLTKAWDSATGDAKAAARENLLNAVGDWGKTHLEEAKAAWIQRVAELPKILSSEQLKSAQTWDPSKAPPATRPAKATLTANPAITPRADRMARLAAATQPAAPTTQPVAPTTQPAK